MSPGPTTGASDPVTRTWAASPAMAWLVRALVFVVPIVAGWAMVRSLSWVFLRPAGWGGVAVWAVQALVVAAVTATVVDRLAQRILPLATLMGMSLTFPDQAPSRFGLALRTGTVRKLSAELADLERNGLGRTTQEAAVRAIELVTLLGQHERLTRGHTERVRAHAEVIAVELGLPGTDRQLLAWGALLHDIGKLTVPPEILNKDGRPTDQEWAILAGHPAAGARLLEPLADWLGDWVKAAAEHHERWDGGGYPRGLAGNEISLAGRITAVADAYDVITSRRSYKPPLSLGAARKELVDCAGSQFDPAVVRALLMASVRRRRHAAGFLSWLPELPGIASVANGVASAPAAVATAAVAVAAPLTGMVTPPPDDLAYAVPVVVEGPAETATTGSTEPSTTAEPSSTAGGGPDVAPTSGAPESSGTEAIETANSSTTGSTTGFTTSSTTTTASTTGVTTTAAAVTTTAAPTTVAAPPTTTTASQTTTAPAVTTTTTTSATTATTGATAGPTGQDDAGTQKQGQQKQYPVLSNDLEGGAPLDPATMTITSPPAHGKAEVWDSTKIRYTADAGFVGTDSLVYRVCDTDGLCAEATLTIALTS